MNADITAAILGAYPDTQAIYLFGSWGTEDEWPNSDIDIAVLLPPEQAQFVDFWAWLQLSGHLSTIVYKDVDLLNIRQASTVLQKEVVVAERRIYTGDSYAADEFEMLTLSFYQKLNEERADILAEFKLTGTAYRV